MEITTTMIIEDNEIKVCGMDMETFTAESECI